MLLNCPECQLQVSDKATTCPHCGYPLQSVYTERKPEWLKSEIEKIK